MCPKHVPCAFAAGIVACNEGLLSVLYSGCLDGCFIVALYGAEILSIKSRDVGGSRRRLPSQLARPPVQEEPHSAAADIGQGSAMDQHASDGTAAVGVQQSQPARERLSGLRPSAAEFQLLSRSLPNPAIPQRVSVGQPAGSSERTSSVFNRLAGRQTASNGVLAFDHRQPELEYQQPAQEFALPYQPPAPINIAGVPVVVRLGKKCDLNSSCAWFLSVEAFRELCVGVDLHCVWISTWKNGKLD